MAELDHAFATVWAMIGEPIPEHEPASSEAIVPEGETALGVLSVFLAVLFGFFPRVIAYSLVLLLIWFASALLYQGWKLRRAKRK